MVKQYQKALVWIKREFRLHDNEALTAALRASHSVMPLYVYEPLVHQGPDWGMPHARAVMDGVQSMRANLRHHGSELAIRHGDMVSVLENVHQAYPFEAVYAYQETGLTHTFERDKQVMRWCRTRGIACLDFQTNGVVRGLKDRNKRAVFFRRYVEQPLMPIPKTHLHNAPVPRLELGDVAQSFPVAADDRATSLPPVTERAAHQTLHDFLYQRGLRYSGGISSMNTAPDACSRISIHLAWGTLSLRTVLRKTYDRLHELQPDQDQASKQWKRSLRKFVSRLFWHAHFVQKLEDEVAMEYRAVNPVFRSGLPVVQGDELERRLAAWRVGQTGFPAIDAAMRAYAATGWLNFRSRAMITSFACHALRIPWQVIIYELAQLMHDYVPGIHVSQVQMQAGVTGTNTIRVYSPHKQLEDHDPECRFVQKWVPELQTYTPSQIQHHYTDPLPGYAEPIIDFKAETKLMKDALYVKKKSPAGRRHAAKVYQKHGSRK